MTRIVCGRTKCDYWKHAEDTTLPLVGICQSEEVVISYRRGCSTFFHEIIRSSTPKTKDMTDEELCKLIRESGGWLDERDLKRYRSSALKVIE